MTGKARMEGAPRSGDRRALFARNSPRTMGTEQLKRNYGWEERAAVGLRRFLRQAEKAMAGGDWAIDLHGVNKRYRGRGGGVHALCFVFVGLRFG